MQAQMGNGQQDMRAQAGTSVNGMPSPGIGAGPQSQQPQVRRVTPAQAGQMGPPPPRQNGSPAPSPQNFLGARLANGQIISQQMIANLQRAGQQPINNQVPMQMGNPPLTPEAMRALAQTFAANGNGVNNISPEMIASIMASQQSRVNPPPLHTNFQIPNGVHPPHSASSASPVSANGMQQSPRLNPAQAAASLQLNNAGFQLPNGGGNGGGGLVMDQLTKMMPSMTPQQLKMLQRQHSQQIEAQRQQQQGNGNGDIAQGGLPNGMQGGMPMMNGLPNGGMPNGAQPIPGGQVVQQGQQQQGQQGQQQQQQQQQQMNLNLKLPNGRLAQLAQANGQVRRTGGGNTTSGSPQMAQAMPVGGPGH